MQKAKEQLLELNEAFQEAFRLMEYTNKHVFVTGRAGTGKSTLLRYFREHTKKNVVVLAPTGVAAVNVQGQTIHSFFQFKPNVTLGKVRRIPPKEGYEDVYSKVETIIIDEVSMVRADLIDCVDKFLRINRNDKSRAFGGVQMIFIGDLYQLPPVVTTAEKHIFSTHYDSPYFFSAHVFSPQAALFSDENSCQMELVELEKVYRQKDQDFVALLNAIRNSTADAETIATLNERHKPHFTHEPHEGYITLTTTNDMAAEINVLELEKLDTEDFTYNGEKHGLFDEKYLPTDEALTVKIGAQVMMLNNDVAGRWINGTIGIVKAVRPGEEPGEQDSIVVALQTGETVNVYPHRWDIYDFTYNNEKKQIESESVGSFTQYPIRLAWAVTIHKSQGKTFHRAVIDLGRGTFSPGQLYVALSRCTTFRGIVLRRPIERRHFWIDTKVGAFLKQYERTH
ncbi:MAG TPA: AAA family ATPase [Candidatus Kapabacteria bacterium]|nr:AAA family ATPase [Candidatus Kapabacteria bacterium]